MVEPWLDDHINPRSAREQLRMFRTVPPLHAEELHLTGVRLAHLDFKMRAGLSDRTNLRDFDIFDEHRGPTIFAAKRRKSRNLPNRRKIEVT